MIRTKLITLCISIFFFCSCAYKPLTSGVRSKDINDLQKFETFSYIALVKKGNKAFINDSVSKKSKEIFDETLATFDKLPLAGTITVNDTAIFSQIENEIAMLVFTADKNRKISNLNLTPAIDSLLEAKGKRFGLLIVTTGFTRTKANLVLQELKGAAVGLFTLGLFYLSPIKANSTAYAMIVDAKENNIAFFKKSYLYEKEPLDKDVIRLQINLLFDRYFWKYKIVLQD